jgi:hypothetical protein
LRGRTVGRQLDSKPTIELPTANLPIHTAAQCRVDHIAFLDRRPGARAGVARIGREEARDRLQQDLPSLDPELDARRWEVARSMAEAPAFDLRYSDCEEAAVLLERIVCAGERA